MVDLTKPVVAVQTTVQKTVSKVADSKTVQTVTNDAAAKLAHELELVDVIAKCAQAQGKANIPSYVYDIARKLGR